MDEGRLSDGLRSGLEALSGMAMDHVRVHRNSSRPGEIHAEAFTQGGDIHLGPGQEDHLAHEAWHVVQQAQGRVPSTIHAKGVSANADARLEMEADEMGARALAHAGTAAMQPRASLQAAAPAHASGVTQMREWYAYGSANSLPHVHCYNSGSHLKIVDGNRVHRYNIVQDGRLHAQRVEALRCATDVQAAHPTLHGVITDLIEEAS